MDRIVRAVIELTMDDDSILILEPDGDDITATTEMRYDEGDTHELRTMSGDVIISHRDPDTITGVDVIISGTGVTQRVIPPPEPPEVTDLSSRPAPLDLDDLSVGSDEASPYGIPRLAGNTEMEALTDRLRAIPDAIIRPFERVVMAHRDAYRVAGVKPPAGVIVAMPEWMVADMIFYMEKTLEENPDKYDIGEFTPTDMDIFATYIFGEGVVVSIDTYDESGQDEPNPVDVALPKPCVPVACPPVADDYVYVPRPTVVITAAHRRACDVAFVEWLDDTTHSRSDLNEMYITPMTSSRLRGYLPKPGDTFIRGYDGDSPAKMRDIYSELQHACRVAGVVVWWDSDDKIGRIIDRAELERDLAERSLDF